MGPEAAVEEERRLCDACEGRERGELFTADDLREILGRYFLEGVRVGRHLPTPGGEEAFWGGVTTPFAPNHPPSAEEAGAYGVSVLRSVEAETRGQTLGPSDPSDWVCAVCEKTKADLAAGVQLRVRLVSSEVLCDECLVEREEWEDAVEAQYYEEVDPEVRAARGDSPRLY